MGEVVCFVSCCVMVSQESQEGLRKNTQFIILTVPGDGKHGMQDHAEKPQGGEETEDRRRRCTLAVAFYWGFWQERPGGAG